MTHRNFLLHFFRHTFRTLRQVEEFLQLPCFDYRDFILKQPLSLPGGSTEGLPEAVGLSGIFRGSGNDELQEPLQVGTEEDDGFYEINAQISKASSKANGNAEEEIEVLKPPKRVPVTMPEKVSMSSYLYVT